MRAADSRFTGSIPALYEGDLVPLAFEPYAQDLAGRLGAPREGLVIEVAAGTGVVTRALRRARPSPVRIVATDRNEAMVAVAAGRASEPSITSLQADALILRFEDATADAVVYHFGAMFFPDRAKRYRETRRVVRPAGRYLFNVWDRLDRNEASSIASRPVGARRRA